MNARARRFAHPVPERGSEIVQSVVAVTLVLAVTFSVVQVGALTLSVNRLTADLTRACRQLDTAGLALAADKERFVANEVLGAATQLRPDLLRVANVRVTNAGEERSLQAGGAPGAQPGSGAAGSTVVQRTDAARVSFDVAYELPSVAAVPGLSHRVIARHVTCEHVEGRIVEVAVEP